MKYIDIGHTQLARHACGDGAPTVVLETGLGLDSDAWETVQHGVAAFARVVRYDRANRAQSGLAPKPRTAADMVRDLHTLLRAAALPAPFVLVGQSFGGLLARLFAHTFVDEVAGIVLVDSLHEDQFEVLGPALPKVRMGEPDAIANMRRFWQGGWRDPDNNAEGIDFVATQAQAKAVLSLGDLPISILTAGSYTDTALFPMPYGPSLQALWWDLHAQFGRLSSRAEHTFVPHSGHFVQCDAPEAVIEAVQRMCVAVICDPSQ